MQELTLLSRTPELCFGLSGEIDSQNAEDFYAAVTGEYALSPADMVLECARLDFIDSTTLGTLVKLHKKLKEDGHRLILRHLPPKLKKLFVICALDTILEIEQ